MIVMKFGGSSVANAERIKHVASIIKAYQDKRPAVVLSAMGDTTDHLLEAADKAVLGEVDVAGVAKLHEDTAAELGINIETIQALLTELKQLLTGISMLKEISKRSRDYLVMSGSFRCSGPSSSPRGRRTPTAPPSEGRTCTPAEAFRQPSGSVSRRTPSRRPRRLFQRDSRRLSGSSTDCSP